MATQADATNDGDKTLSELTAMPEEELRKLVSGGTDTEIPLVETPDPLEKSPEQKRIEELEQSLAKANDTATKRVSDAQRRLHEVTGELAEQKRKGAERERESNKHPLLKENPELDEAIQQELNARSTPQEVEDPDPRVQWYDDVKEALADAELDLDALAANPDTLAELQKLQGTMDQAKWNRPAVAARRIVEHITETRRLATEAGKVEEAKQKKLAAMGIPHKAGSAPPAKAGVKSEAQMAKDIRSGKITNPDEINAYLRDLSA